MKRTKLHQILALLLFVSCQPGHAQTTFTYQGKLNDNGSPANGSYDLRFYLRDALTAGNSVGATNTVPSAQVSNGLFTVTLDFGSGVFTGSARWLEMGVRTNGSVGSYTLLSPRQPLTAAPYALYATNAGSASTAGSVALGSVTAAGIASAQVVKTLNGLKDNVTLAAGANVTLTTNGNTLMVGSTSGAGVWSLNGTSAFYNAGNVGVGTSGPGFPLEVARPNDGGTIFRIGNVGGSGFNFARHNFTGVLSVQGNQVGFNDIVLAPTSGRVGIGTSSPTFPLDVSGIVHGVSGSQNWQQGAILGEVPAGAGGGESSAIRGINHSAGGYGLYATHESSGIGVFGTAYGGSGLGVQGANAYSKNYGQLGTANYGVYGQHFAAQNDGRLGDSIAGVRGVAAAVNSASVGVRGEHYTSGNYGQLGTTNAGVYGHGSIGVHGHSGYGRGLFGESSGGQGFDGGTGYPQLDLLQDHPSYPCSIRMGVVGNVGEFMPPWYISVRPNFQSQLTFNNVYERMAIDYVGNVRATSFNATSDRSSKENFTDVSPREMLAKVVALPISAWNFKEHKSVKHVGPMAQDFYAAFGLGLDEKHIATVDADGVALAAIQGLNEIVKEKEARISQLEKRFADLEHLFNKLSERSK